MKFNYLDSAVSFFLPEKRVSDFDRNKQAFFIKVCLLFVVICFSFGFAYQVFSAPYLKWVMFCGGTLLFLPPLFLRFGGELEKSMILGLVTGVAIVLGASFVTGGIKSPTLFWNILIPMFSGSLLGRRVGIIFAGLGFLQFAVLGIVEYQGFQFPNEHMAHDPVAIIIANLGIMTLACAAFTYWFLRIKENVIEDLKSAVSEIHSTKGQLETKLEENNLLMRVLFHDMANPLAITLGSCQVAKKLNKDQELTKWLEKMERSSEAQRLVLDKVRAIQAKKELVLKEVNLMEVISEVLFLFDEKLQRKNIQLNLDRQSLSQIHVLGDKVMLINEVFGNLVSNAIKFSYQNGAIDIYIEPPVNQDCVSVTVRDYGIGMTLEQKDRLFKHDGFSEPGTAGELGSGFGLKIVKKSLDSMGADIEVESLEGGEQSGTKITISLKMALSQTHQSAA